MFSDASDKAVINDESAGTQLLSTRFATRCIQHPHRDGCVTAVSNAAFFSYVFADIAAEFWVNIYTKIFKYCQQYAR